MNYIQLLIGLVIGAILTVGVTKITQPKIVIPKAPDCVCPPSTRVDVGTLDFEQLRKVKGNLTVTQSLDHVTFLIQGKDSVLVKQLLKAVK